MKADVKSDENNKFYCDWIIVKGKKAHYVSCFYPTILFPSAYNYETENSK